MKFVSEHLTTEHMKQAPHRWFAALVLSPIHAAELHYKRQYHITYIHAKKLFFFDLLLILGMGMLLAFTVFWFTFDPTVTQNIFLTIAPDVHDQNNTDKRIRSGEHVSYTITYQNNSDITITDVSLRLQLPEGFIIEQGTRVTPLPDLAPGEGGELELTGFFFEDHEESYHITARLSYSQENKSFTEERISTIIQTLRGSILVPELTVPESILTQGTVPLSLTLTNNNHHLIEDIKVPLPAGSFSLSNTDVSTGEIENNEWILTNLAPGAQETLTAQLNTNITTEENSILFTITPLLLANGREVRQQPAQHTFTILRPSANLTTNWKDTEPMSPGGAKTLVVSIQNNGTVQLTNPKVLFDIPDTVNPTGLTLANSNATIEQNTFLLPVAESLAPGENVNVEISIPTKAWITGEVDQTLRLSPRVQASIAQLALGSYQTPEQTTAAVAIGTNAFLSATIRYYTDEGDQLGRGPLPPRVGEETKYWAFISLQNTSSRLINLSFKADLTPNAIWTGRSSVSHGSGLFYNRANNQVTWNLNRLDAYDTLGLFMELGFVPTEAQRGTTPALLDNIVIQAEDGYTNLPITRTFGAVDISLSEDSIGKNKGVIVQ